MSVIINGSAGVTTNSGAVYNGIQGGTAVASTSGTSIDFTSIPSWVKRVTVMFDGVGTNGTSNLQIQVGSSSVSTSGYIGSALQQSAANSTISSGIPLTGTTTSISFYYGNIVITNISSNTWTATGILWNSAGALNWTAAITPNLSDTLDQVRITTVNGTDAFDAGSINILFE
jgi:hypothetical protein